MTYEKALSLQQQLGLDFYILSTPIIKYGLEYYNYQNFKISFNPKTDEWLVYM
jgi:hypothetical protein